MNYFYRPSVGITCVALHLVIYTHTHTYRGQRRTWVYPFFTIFHLIPLRQGISLNLELTSFSLGWWPASPNDPISLPLPGLG